MSLSVIYTGALIEVVSKILTYYYVPPGISTISAMPIKNYTLKENSEITD